MISPAIASGSRLVASTCRCGHARSSWATSSAHASTRCSQLSSTSSSCFGAQVLGQRARPRCGPACRAVPPPRRRRPAPATGRRARPARPASCRRRSCRRGARDQLLRQARLADAARADQRQQRRRRQHLRELAQLVLAADKAGQRPRQVVLRSFAGGVRGPRRRCRDGAVAVARPGRGGAPARRPAPRTRSRLGPCQTERPRPAAPPCRGVGCARPPRSSSLMLRGLTPARSASSSCVRPAARRWSRSSSPKLADGSSAATRAILADSGRALVVANVAMRVASLAWSATRLSLSLDAL